MVGSFFMSKFKPTYLNGKVYFGEPDNVYLHFPEDVNEGIEVFFDKLTNEHDIEQGRDEWIKYIIELDRTIQFFNKKIQMIIEYDSESRDVTLNFFNEFNELISEREININIDDEGIENLIVYKLFEKLNACLRARGKPLPSGGYTIKQICETIQKEFKVSIPHVSYPRTNGLDT